MGYNTYFEMITFPAMAWTSEEVKEAIKKVEVPCRYMGTSRMDTWVEGDEYDFEEEMKWYDHEEHMVELSKLCPNIIFDLRGDGEETGDMWRSVYFRGEVRTVTAVWPEIDTNDWKQSL